MLLPVPFGGSGKRQAVDVSLPSINQSVHAKSSPVETLTSAVKGLAATTESVKVVTMWYELDGGRAFSGRVQYQAENCD